MLNKKEKSVNPNTTDTLIGEKTVFEGTLRSKASLRIEGRVDGDIHCEGDVTVGKNGIVRSNVTSRNVYNAGIIEGSITSKGMLTITSTGKVQGDIKVKSLSIAEGGVFQGSSRMDIPQEDSKHSAADSHRLHKLEQKRHKDHDNEKQEKAVSG